VEGEGWSVEGGGGSVEGGERSVKGGRWRDAKRAVVLAALFDSSLPSRCRRLVRSTRLKPPDFSAIGILERIVCNVAVVSDGPF
jgi:hypothetical protein